MTAAALYQQPLHARQKRGCKPGQVKQRNTSKKKQKNNKTHVHNPSQAHGGGGGGGGGGVGARLGQRPAALALMPVPPSHYPISILFSSIFFFLFSFLILPFCHLLLSFVLSPDRCPAGPPPPGAQCTYRHFDGRSGSVAGSATGLVIPLWATVA